MPLKNDWVDGEEYTTDAQNAVADAVNTLTAYHIDSYGADPTGATASDTAVQAAITAMGTSPGILEFGTGTYRLTAGHTLSYPGQGIVGQGLGTTRLDWRGTGDCFMVWDSTVPQDASTTPGRAGPIVGFTLWGWDNTNSAVGLHLSDLDGLYVRDVHVSGLGESGSIGVWFENHYSWSERADVAMTAEYCDTDFVFDRNASHPADTTSYSYSTFNLGASVQVDQSALVVRNNSGLQGVDLTLFGTASCAATTNTGVVITVGTTGSDTSYISGHVLVAYESIGFGGPVGHFDINTGNSGVRAISGYGQIVMEEWGNGGTGLFQKGTAVPVWAGDASGTVQFAGRTSCPSLGNIGGYGQMAAQSAAQHVFGKFCADGVWDNTYGNMILELYGGENAVNNLLIANAAASLNPTIVAEGASTNIGIIFQPKGTGVFGFWQDTGQTVSTISAAGTATNVSLNLVTQAAGTVQANGNPVGIRVSPPATAGAAGTPGMWASDSTYLYVCTATNTWVRASVSFATW